VVNVHKVKVRLFVPKREFTSILCMEISQTDDIMLLGLFCHNCWQIVSRGHHLATQRLNRSR
jgi:hypothetical protein